MGSFWMLYGVFQALRIALAAFLAYVTGATMLKGDLDMRYFLRGYFPGSNETPNAN